MQVHSNLVSGNFNSNIIRTISELCCPIQVLVLRPARNVHVSALLVHVHAQPQKAFGYGNCFMYSIHHDGVEHSQMFLLAVQIGDLVRIKKNAPTR